MWSFLFDSIKEYVPKSFEKVYDFGNNCVSNVLTFVKKYFASFEKKTKRKSKKGKVYATVKDDLESFDLVMFAGPDFISDYIRYMQNKCLKKESTAGYKVYPGEYSHVGMIVKSDILEDENVKPGEVYLWESTMSGRLSDGVPNVQNKSYLGVQLRDFSKVVVGYDKPIETKIAVCKLKPEFRPEITPELKQEFTQYFQRVNGTRYDINPISLWSNAWLKLRKIREITEDFFGTEDFLFCSELVASVYTHFNILPKEINPKNVVPMDFLGFDVDTNACPVVVNKPEPIVSDKWIENKQKNEK